MADSRKIAGLAMTTVVAIGSGVLLYFVLTRMFPKLEIAIRGREAVMR